MLTSLYLIFLFFVIVFSVLTISQIYEVLHSQHTYKPVLVSYHEGVN